MRPKRKEKPKESGLKKNELEELRDKIDSLQEEKDELFGKLQRVSADYANFQKRAPKQVAEAIAYEREKIIKTLLPALDNFEHTLQNAEAAENAGVFVKGIEIIYDQMLDILKSHGVERITAAGEKFDPAVHEAVMQKSEPEREEGVVLEEFQTGYTLNGRVIRPSKVTVNKSASEEPTQGQAETAEQPSEEFDTIDERETTEAE